MGYQSQRTPISFFSAIFGSKPARVDDAMTREELFVPYKLVISNGESFHWIINRQNAIFNPLWEETKAYLADIEQGKLSAIQSDTADWGDISGKRGFLFEFRTGIKPDLLQWFLGLRELQAGALGVAKVMVKPGSNDETSGEVYILDDEGKVYKYNTSDYTRPKSYNEIVSSLENDEKNTYRVYSSMRDSNFDKVMTIRPDVLYVAKSPKYWPYFTMQGTIPQKALNRLDLAGILLGGEKDRYNNVSYDDGTIQLNNTENLYKLYTDGLLTYTYMSDISAKNSKGSIGPALINAYEFVNRAAKLLDKKDEIYLSGVEDSQQGFYKFKFDYKVNGLPVFTNFALQGNEGNAMASEGNLLRNAIIIDSNGTQVLKCSWVLREFIRTGKNEYNDNFLDYSVDYKSMKIADISAGYVINAGKATELGPSIIIEKMGGAGIQVVGMPAREVK